jgi:hypothetical protein
LGIKHPIMAGAEQFSALLIVVHGTGEMGTPSAVGDEASIRQVQQDGMIIGSGVLEVVYSSSRHVCCPSDDLSAYRLEWLEVVQSNYAGSGGKQGPGGHHGKAEEVTSGNLLVSIPMIGEFRPPARETPGNSGRVIF